MENQYTPRDTDKPKSGRYEVIQLQILIGHTTPDNKNHCNVK